MTTRWAFSACALAAAALAAGCSSSPPPAYEPPDGALIPGTAQVTVNGRDAGTTHSVSCMTIESLTMISTGGEDSGVYTMVSNAEDLDVRLLRITDLGGFTGSYNQGLEGEATVTMTDRTFDINGEAVGFDLDDPSFRSTSTFGVKIAC
ncbi:MAG: lipoprotein LpqH [Actinomycetota bacterium]|nr:lipoprotein LpqH [Actinomycetota bacterium]